MAVQHQLFDDTDDATARAYMDIVRGMSPEHRARKFAEINHLAKVSLRERVRRERGPMTVAEESIAIAEETLKEPLLSQFIEAVRRRDREATE